ncbi:MAG TPA: RNA polymerase sigma factor [Fimbriimonadaceae bacterium]|nr:RNA polymerase sigma factor [Fimbriimonadaceae bacterium]
MDFERQVSRHKNAVYRQMVRACGNAQDAEDVLVEALIKAYRAADQLDDPRAFRSWLTTIGKRVCTRLRQRTGRLKTESLDALADAGFQVPEPSGSTQADLMEMKEMHRCVMEAFDTLPSNYRDVYRLRELEGFSVKETAKKLGLTEAGVKTRLHRARATLRQLLDSSISP